MNGPRMRRLATHWPKVAESSRSTYLEHTVEATTHLQIRKQIE
jgi:hypothetical protein